MLFDCLIALGSNLRERHSNLNRALQLLAASDDANDLCASGFLATQPIGGPRGQGEFLNAAATLRTDLSAADLFKLLKTVERQIGRQHTERWGPRVIDLDLLLHGETVLASDVSLDLIVPHPRMAFRRFVLEPAAEVAPNMLHPVIGWTIAELLGHLQNCPPHIAILSGDPTHARQLSKDVSAATGATILSAEQIDLLGMSAWDADEVLCDGPINEPVAQSPKLTIIQGRAPQELTGPSLEVSNLSQERACAEVVAAIEAMRE